MRDDLIKSLRALALVYVACAAAVAAQPPAAQHPTRQPYTWKNVQIVGGGFVDGVIFHPTVAGIRYARTDMGGAYRWDQKADRWQPILDWVPYKDLNLMGVESIAVDPADARRVYLACGTYTNANTPNGAILRSDDGGRTFERTDVPFKFGGNEDGRGNGERMAVDPGDGKVLYLGTRHDGLWRSTDQGVSWQQVTAFPDVTEAQPEMPKHVAGESPEQFWRRMPVRGSGIVFVKFVTDGEKHTAGAATQTIPTHTMPTQTIFVGVSLMNRPNLFVTRDGGATWQPVDGEPTQYRPTRAALSRDGYLYIAYGNAPGPSHMTNGAVWKLNIKTGNWTDITPEHPVAGSREFGYAAVAIDAKHPQTVIASSFGRPGGEDIFRSTDGGTSWRPIFTGPAASAGIYDYARAPYVKPTPIHWLFDIEIDPANSDHALFTTGYGGWETFDLTAADRELPTHWRMLAAGIEETVALEMVSPTSGAHLVSAIGDYGGFVHWDLDQPAPEGASSPPRFGNTTGVASAALKPEILVRVGISAAHHAGENISYSLDGGKTWQGTASNPAPTSQSGSVAVSADGRTWIWAPQRETPTLTRDNGATWTTVQGLPAGTKAIADPVNPSLFYAVEMRDGTFFRSSDGGATFTAQHIKTSDTPAPYDARHRGDARGGQDHIYATPGRTGDLWLAAFDGLYRLSTEAAQDASFTRMPGVETIEAFGFGKAAPHRSYPTLYLVGTVDGQNGVFRSTDEAHTWVRINDDKHQWGLVLQVIGDPRIFGRVYVGTHGRGISYGDPAGK
jgi:photosystem II stability/assembly factor-like uncharacterized protein